MTEKTVFVIGAGASREVNLPTGSELKKDISNLLNIQFDFRQISGDVCISNAIEKHITANDDRKTIFNSYLNAAWHIRDTLPLAISIDNLIDNHRENEKIALCGKLAIVRSILEAEKNSQLYINRSNGDQEINFDGIEDTWYLPFFRLLTENCGKDELKKRFNSTTLIIFNYDRCIEHFLHNALQKYYGISDTEAAELICEIDMYHPYGCVGNLPLLKINSPTMEFGRNPTPEQLLHLANEIKTFTEGTDPDSSEIIEIRKHISNTKKLVLLGFAFHKLNMQLIAPNNKETVEKRDLRAYASTYGVSENDQRVIHEQINRLYGCDIDTRMAKLKCNDFFGEFWRSLSF